MSLSVDPVPVNWMSPTRSYAPVLKVIVMLESLICAVSFAPGLTPPAQLAAEFQSLPWPPTQTIVERTVRSSRASISGAMAAFRLVWARRWTTGRSHTRRA